MSNECVSKHAYGDLVWAVTSTLGGDECWWPAQKIPLALCEQLEVGYDPADFFEEAVKNFKPERPFVVKFYGDGSYSEVCDSKARPLSLDENDSTHKEALKQPNKRIFKSSEKVQFSKALKEVQYVLAKRVGKLGEWKSPNPGDKFGPGKSNLEFKPFDVKQNERWADFEQGTLKDCALEDELIDKVMLGPGKRKKKKRAPAAAAPAEAAAVAAAKSEAKTSPEPPAKKPKTIAQGAMTEEQKERLKELFYGQNETFPDPPRRREIASETGIPYDRVSGWFASERYSVKKGKKTLYKPADKAASAGSDQKKSAGRASVAAQMMGVGETYRDQKKAAAKTGGGSALQPASALTPLDTSGGAMRGAAAGGPSSPTSTATRSPKEKTFPAHHNTVQIQFNDHDVPSESMVKAFAGKFGEVSKVYRLLSAKQLLVIFKEAPGAHACANKALVSGCFGLSADKRDFEVSTKAGEMLVSSTKAKGSTSGGGGGGNAFNTKVNNKMGQRGGPAKYGSTSAMGAMDGRKGLDRSSSGMVGGMEGRYEYGRSAQRSTGQQLCALLQKTGVKQETLTNLEKLKNMSPHASALSELFLKLVEAQAVGR